MCVFRTKRHEICTLTGLIDVGEHLPDGAAREVLEETGVETEFDSVLAFRHGHFGLFGKSDLFFVVRMRLKPGSDASILRPQVRVKGPGLSPPPPSLTQVTALYLYGSC